MNKNTNDPKGYFDLSDEEKKAIIDKASRQSALCKEHMEYHGVCADQSQEDWPNRFKSEWLERVKVNKEGYVQLDSAHLGTWLIPFINSLLKQKERETYDRGYKEGYGDKESDGITRQYWKRVAVEQSVAKDILGMIGEPEEYPERGGGKRNGIVHWRNKLRFEIKSAISSKYKVKEEDK